MQDASTDKESTRWRLNFQNSIDYGNELELIRFHRSFSFKRTMSLWPFSTPSTFQDLIFDRSLWSWIKKLLMQSFKIQLKSKRRFLADFSSEAVSADIFVYYHCIKDLSPRTIPLQFQGAIFGAIKFWSEVEPEVSQKCPLLIISVIFWETWDSTEAFGFIIRYTSSEF